MALDLILTDGDLAIFKGSFGDATVTVRPGIIRGSGPAKLKGKPICVKGDESSVKVMGCPYFTANFPMPGTGMLMIESVHDKSVAEHCLVKGTEILLLGGDFKAIFEVMVPAIKPGPKPENDQPKKQYKGSGSFNASNKTHKAT